jgi:hypothetical protein
MQEAGMTLKVPSFDDLMQPTLDALRALGGNPSVASYTCGVCGFVYNERGVRRRGRLRAEE